MKPISIRNALIINAMFLIPAILLYANESTNGISISYFDSIEKRTGGYLGVSALDTATGKSIEYHSDDRFAMCSTFKLLLVAAILARVDENRDSLDRIISYQSDDLLDYAPITTRNVDNGRMKLSELCAAAIEYSDNTATNLLLETIGGPERLTTYVHSLGDSITRIDRNEPFLNSNIPGDVRDTTSPKAMRSTIVKLLIDDTLSSASRKQLEEWLIASKTGSARLRAGIPSAWRIGNKTGSGRNGATNDVAIVWPPKRSPIIIAVYFTNTSISRDEREAVIAEVGRIITTEFTETPNKAQHVTSPY